MRKDPLPVILFLLIIPLINLSAEAMSLDRDTSLSLALENNTDLLDAAISLKTYKREADASWNVFLPDVGASLNLGGSASTTGSTSVNALSLSPGISLSYTLSPGLKETLNQLKLNAENSSINYEEIRLQLLLDVESEFYYLLTSRNNLEIEEKNIELAGKQYEQMQVKFKNGLASELEVLQARVNVANLIPTYSSLESTYNNRLKEFLVVLGIDPLTEVELSGSLEVEDRELDSEKLITRYLNNRSDIKAQKKKIEILENSLNQSKKQGHLPAVTLSASWAEEIGSPFSSLTWQDYSTNNTGAFSLGVSLGLDNYLPDSSTDLGIKEIEDSIESAKLALDNLIQTARLEIINLVDSLNTDRENLELSKLNVELSEKSYQMTEESFARGKTDRMTLDDAQQDLLTARQNLLESQYEYMNDLITLRGALGIESLDELEE